uniref:Uncharacterized protein n=1 Tax=Picea glauca TaxID=3330 RepID=A0A124GNX2_PICGL|nr:hypothetical protein ABT39_MTgene3364 [Picea glauca]QHR89127.1 hypothetical protein Q903MT_gene3146 [Picea sitchensis]
MRDKLRARALLSSSGTQHTWFIYFYIINSGRYPTWSYSLQRMADLPDASSGCPGSERMSRAPHSLTSPTDPCMQHSQL